MHGAPTVRSGDRIAAGVVDVVVAALLGLTLVQLSAATDLHLLVRVAGAVGVLSIAGGALDRFGPGTLGRFVAGLRLRRPDTARPGFLRATARWLVPVAIGVLTAVGAYGWLLIGAVLAIVEVALIRRTGRSLLDRSTGTVVLRPLGGANLSPSFAMLDSGAPIGRRDPSS